MAQVFSCEFYEISKNTSFTERLCATASECDPHINLQRQILESSILEDITDVIIIIIKCYYLVH